MDCPVKEAKERVHIGCKDQKNLHTANETQHMANNDSSFQFADGNSTVSKYAINVDNTNESPQSQCSYRLST